MPVYIPPSRGSGSSGTISGSYYTQYQTDAKFATISTVSSISGQVNSLISLVSVSGSSTLLNNISSVVQTNTPIITTLWQSPIPGNIINIKNNTSTGSNTISGNGYNIEGSSTFIIYNNESFTFRFDGTSWLAF